MEQGERPPFSVGGSWLYCDGRPVVHLIEVPEGTPWTLGSLEHFAFEAQGLRAFLDHLQAGGTPYQIAPVPGIGVRQVHLHDPDGNHIHIDFPPDEAM
jgi:catechol 2,3-dioxygenase-like lactoylglutathione lyase family enzyme